jgi:hypothetical protein
MSYSSLPLLPQLQHRLVGSLQHIGAVKGIWVVASPLITVAMLQLII